MDKKLIALYVGLCICSIYWNCTQNPESSDIGNEFSDLHMTNFITLDNHYIDINCDSVYDFQLVQCYLHTTDIPVSGMSQIISIQALDSNEVGYIENDSNSSLACGDTIDSTSLIWTEYIDIAHLSTDLKRGEVSWSSSLCDSVKNYIGVRLISQNRYYYGWIRAYMDENLHLSVVDYGINLYPYDEIIAGYH